MVNMASKATAKLLQLLSMAMHPKVTARQNVPIPLALLSRVVSSTASTVSLSASTTQATLKDILITSTYHNHQRSGDIANISFSGSPPPQEGQGYAAPPHQQYGQEGYRDPNAPQHQHQPQGQPGYQDPNAPYDPNMPEGAEGDRGIMGAIGGGIAGRYAGKRMGDHSILGMIGGAIAGSKLEDYAKKQHHSGSHHSSNPGGSSWGGSQGGRW